MTDLLMAISNIINNPIPDIINHYQTVSNNRINAIGDGLEEFIKDAFANTIIETDLGIKVKKCRKT
ncbi:MAG: NgoPII family restriction endonuclease [Xenococcaceae cyanobacterium MO_207.B15]|nr:NgoPII family restriction endonuclease [Xenococcaceae cyanobacterium MO_207.B15]